jgi:hypothetical protein
LFCSFTLVTFRACLEYIKSNQLSHLIDNSIIPLISPRTSNIITLNSSMTNIHNNSNIVHHDNLLNGVSNLNNNNNNNESSKSTKLIGKQIINSKAENIEVAQQTTSSNINNNTTPIFKAPPSVIDLRNRNDENALGDFLTTLKSESSMVLSKNDFKL